MRKPRSRAYNRDVSMRKALRKKRISDSWGDSDWHWYEHLHQYDKGKIHCSCGLCMAKTRNKGYHRRHIHGNYAPSINYKVNDLRKQQAMDADEADYYYLINRLVAPLDIIIKLYYNYYRD